VEVQASAAATDQSADGWKHAAQSAAYAVGAAAVQAVCAQLVGNQAEKQEAAARVLQAAWRARQARRLQARQLAALCLQSAWRGRQARRTGADRMAGKRCAARATRCTNIDARFCSPCPIMAWHVFCVTGPAMVDYPHASARRGGTSIHQLAPMLACGACRSRGA
jgi:hypothetical protein